MMRYLLLPLLLLAACGPVNRLFSDDPRITAFTVSPNPVDRGAEVTLTWHAENADHVEIRVTLADYNFGDPWLRPLQPTVDDLPLQGSWVYAVPPDARRPPRFFIDAVGVDGAGATVTSEVVTYAEYPCIRPDLVCTAPAQTVTTTYQEYSDGHLLLQAETGRAYVLSKTLPLWRVYPFAGGAAADFLATQPDLAADLGAVLGDPVTYSAGVQQHISTEAMFDQVLLSWHDGRVAALVGRAWETGGPSWMLPDAGSG